MEVFKVQSTVELNINEVMSGLDKVEDKSKSTVTNMDKIGDTAKETSGKFTTLGEYGKKGLSVIDSLAKKCAIAVSALATGMLALGMKSNASLETSSVAWTTLLGTQEEAKKMIEDITKYAATTPFSKMGVDEMSKQLHNAGYKGQELFDQLTKFGNMGSAFGVQEDSLKEMVRQYSQVQMAGVAYTEDLNIIQDRGIPIYKALAETLGITTGEVKKMAGEGKISADIYNEAINSIAKNTNGAMDSQSKTFSGMWSTIEDNFVNISQKIIEPIFNKVIEWMPLIIEFADQFSANLDEGKGILDSLKESIMSVFGEDTYNKVSNITMVVTGLAVAYGILKTVMFVSSLINSVSTAWGVLSTALGLNTVVTEGATVAQTGLNLAFLASPITWIIIAIGAIVGAFIYLWNNVEGFRNFWINTWEGVKTSCGNAKDYIVNKFTEMKASAIEKFNAIKEGITKPIESAKEKIRNTIENIKSFFNFQWQFPKLKMPHFSVNGSANPLKWLSEGVPRVNVEWYAKGGIMTQPTLFGMNGNKAMVGGEAGDEAILPLKPFYDYMDSKLSELNKDIVLQIDGREFMRAVAQYQDEFNKYNNRNAQYSYW